jgi:hypothetical protein
MNYKKEIKLLFYTIAIAYSLIFAFGINDIYLSGNCKTQQGGDFFHCLGIAMIPDQFQTLSLFFLVMLVFLLSPLYFLREEVYLAWRKFALWYLPIAAILLFIARPSGGGMSLGFDRESLTFHFSAYFALISILIMFIKSIKLRGK